MSQSLSNILVHIVFSTKNRESFIKESISSELYAYITKICQSYDSPIKQIGGMPDHVHLLLSLSRKISLADLVKKIKSNSSRWIKSKGIGYKLFAWQNGYGAFSIGQSGFKSCAKYIANQKNHHKKVSFKDELKILLVKYCIEFNEKYLWD